MENYAPSKKIIVLENIRVGQVSQLDDSANSPIQNFFASYGEEYDEYSASAEITKITGYVDECDGYSESRSPIPVSTFTKPTATPEIMDLEPYTESIVDAVRSRPPLWNIQDKNFRNRVLKRNLWTEVTSDSNLENTETNVLRVKKYWENIKASYVRSRKRLPSGAAAGSKEYKFAKILSFLDDVGEPRRSTDVCGDIDCSEDLVSGRQSEESGSITPNSRKRQNVQERTLELQHRYVDLLENRTAASTAPSNIGPTQPNAIDGFLMSMKPYLEELEILPRLLAQQDILKVLSDAIIKQNDGKR